KRHTAGVPSYLLSNGFLGLRAEGTFPSILVDFPNILIKAAVCLLDIVPKESATGITISNTPHHSMNWENRWNCHKKSKVWNEKNQTKSAP
ncbi:hypothetical protein ACQP3D_27490, partial [Escherichia coli]